MKAIKFRLPRKLKKKVKKLFLLYPLDKITETYLMAWPHRIEEDYKAFKSGILKDILER